MGGNLVRLGMGRGVIQRSLEGWLYGVGSVQMVYLNWQFQSLLKGLFVKVWVSLGFGGMGVVGVIILGIEVGGESGYLYFKGEYCGQERMKLI